MKPTLRIVTRLPLETLWDAYGAFGRRRRRLETGDIRALLSEQPVRFVEAHIGAPLRWFDTAACFETWKRVRPHIADARAFYLSDFPGETAAVASEWIGRLDERLIMLEWQH